MLLACETRRLVPGKAERIEWFQRNDNRLVQEITRKAGFFSQVSFHLSTPSVRLRSIQ